MNGCDSVRQTKAMSWGYCCSEDKTSADNSERDLPDILV